MQNSVLMYAHSVNVCTQPLCTLSASSRSVLLYGIKGGEEACTAGRVLAGAAVPGCQ